MGLGRNVSSGMEWVTNTGLSDKNHNRSAVHQDRNRISSLLTPMSVCSFGRSFVVGASICLLGSCFIVYTGIMWMGRCSLIITVCWCIGYRHGVPLPPYGGIFFLQDYPLFFEYVLHIGVSSAYQGILCSTGYPLHIVLSSAYCGIPCLLRYHRRIGVSSAY